MFEFNITLDDNDYLLFNQYHLFNSHNGKNFLRYYRFLAPFVSLIIIVIFYIAGSDFELILFEAILMTIISIW
ncbi:MAG: hypothetical protein K0R00_3684 [Herbinix sp.]|nr:hypothetical protein [Herbinix sp.]